jgi:dihydrofolate reductase
MTVLSGGMALARAPLVVLTHQVPERVPAEDPPYTFVTDGIEAAVEQARAMASPKNVHLMGASVVQQAIRAGLLDELIISLVPKVLGQGFGCWTAWTAATSNLRSCASSTPPASHI